MHCVALLIIQPRASINISQRPFHSFIFYGYCILYDVICHRQCQKNAMDAIQYCVVSIKTLVLVIALVNIIKIIKIVLK